MIHQDLTIRVTDIQLDQDNPRFPPVDTQRAAIDAMLADQGEKIATLALDIYQNGLNPSSRLIVFKAGARYVDGDGNRRLTALKLLETPSLAGAFPKIKRRIDAILKRPGEVLTEVLCVVFRDRDSARHWISINHAGEQDGRGHIDWNPEQKDRFERKPSIGLEAIDLLMHKGLISSNEKEQVNKSTLDRLLSYKGVKSDLSISKNGARFVFGNIGHLLKIVLELQGKTVDEVYTAKKGKAFVQRAIAAHGEDDVSSGVDFETDLREPLVRETGRGKRSRRVRTPDLPIFGQKLVLRQGHVNNFYRDIENLYDFYQTEKSRLSGDFIVIIRMSLRLLAETAAKDVKMELKDYLLESFDEAKYSLDQNAKTTLSNQSVRKETIVRLFQTGAHDYHASRNEEQMLALSFVLGAMLMISHEKQ